MGFRLASCDSASRRSRIGLPGRRWHPSLFGDRLAGLKMSSGCWRLFVAGCQSPSWKGLRVEMPDTLDGGGRQPGPRLQKCPRKGSRVPELRYIQAQRDYGNLQSNPGRCEFVGARNCGGVSASDRGQNKNKTKRKRRSGVAGGIKGKIFKQTARGAGV